MDARKLFKLRKELASFLDDVVGDLGHVRRRRWCETYLRGVLLDGQRKSIEPMAARLQQIEQGREDYEQALQQFINQSARDEQAVLDSLQCWIGRQLGADGFLIIDDTGFPKQGEYSVGVARQYTGTLGKVANCQVAVTLQLATGRDVVGVDARLYLPEAWCSDRQRCQKAGIPESVTYQAKWQMALAMLRRAKNNGLGGVVLADSLFGTVTESAVEFLRRFLLHVLPRGFVRIRHFGLLANRQRQQALWRCRELLGPVRPDPGNAPDHAAQSAVRHDGDAGSRLCPACQQGLLHVAQFPRGEFFPGALLAHAPQVLIGCDSS